MIYPKDFDYCKDTARDTIRPIFAWSAAVQMFANDRKTSLPQSIPSPATPVHQHHPVLRRRRLQARFKMHRTSFVSVAGSKKTTSTSPLTETVLTGGRGAEKEMTLWQHYCVRSSVPGFRYLADPTVRLPQRITCLILIGLAALGIVYVSYLLHMRFAKRGLATVVESTGYPIYDIPYPAVLVCNNNRINWLRVPAAIERFLPNASASMTGELVKVLNGLNAFEFGSFDEFKAVKHSWSWSLNHINITLLYLNVIHRCEDLFDGQCWWRNKYMNCCDLFAMQRSEYGICYAFNSATSPRGQQRAANESNYPWRTASYGEWSGLRANVRILQSARMPGLNTAAGILVSVDHPQQWPNSAQMVPVGTRTTITIKPTYSTTSSNVLELPADVRQCRNQDELPNELQCMLPGLPYFRGNCMSACRQSNMLRLCNCTLDFIFPVSNHAQCNISDLQCLFLYDHVFNYEKPPSDNPYFDESEQGIECSCPPECQQLDYSIQISAKTGQPDPELIELDVHFEQATMVQYRTSLVFDWMDLMVGFGGIAGLFMSLSFISMAEAFVYVMLGIMSILKPRKM